MVTLKPTAVLTKRQLLFLDSFNKSQLTQSFYLSGGTALCGFYIPYRYSEDLDFFSQNEFDINAVTIWLKSCKNLLGYETLDIQTTFNRNLVFLQFDDELLKTEFTYYPFPAKKSEYYKRIMVDSLEDIALNKLFTIYQNPRLRDFMDLYMIVSYEKLSLSQLRSDAKVKFDWDIDPIQLGSQFMRAAEKKDVPRVMGTFDFKKMLRFFQVSAGSLKNEILDDSP